GLITRTEADLTPGNDRRAANCPCLLRELRTVRRSEFGSSSAGRGSARPRRANTTHEPRVQDCAMSARWRVRLGVLACVPALALLPAGAAHAHPLGNFTVNHHDRLVPTPHAVPDLALGDAA